MTGSQSFRGGLKTSRTWCLNLSWPTTLWRHDSISQPHTSVIFPTFTLFERNCDLSSLEQDHCVETEAVMQAQNEEMMALVMEQYNNMSISMEEEKKAKLEQLYDQIVSFQDSIDSAKATLETTAREAETEARVRPQTLKSN